MCAGGTILNAKYFLSKNIYIEREAPQSSATKLLFLFKMDMASILTPGGLFSFCFSTILNIPHWDDERVAHDLQSTGPPL